MSLIINQDLLHKLYENPNFIKNIKINVNNFIKYTIILISLHQKYLIFEGEKINDRSSFFMRDLFNMEYHFYFL